MDKEKSSKKFNKTCRVKYSTFTSSKRRRRGFKGTHAWHKNSVNNVNSVNNMDISMNEVESSANIVNTESTPVNIECTSKNNESVNSESQTNLSSSSRKVEEILSPSTPRGKGLINGYRIIDTNILSMVISSLFCPQCEQQALILGDRLVKKQGLASLLYVKCSNCDYVNEFYTSEKTKQSFDVNNRIVYTMRTMGHGHSGVEKFTSLMNMPKPMTRNNYDKLVTKIANITKTVAEYTMSDAADELRESVETCQVVDTTVSCDGTWQKRGFQSLNGVFAAISVESGKVLDVEPMSRSCKACCMKETMRKEDPDRYAEWCNSHICTYNYQGTAGGMETEGAKRVFERSINKHNLRYTEFLGDGDSKSFLTVKNVYSNVEVKKLECVGHYQKRVGTRLRNLKKREKGLGGRGRLTDAMIDRLQNFFGLAIRQNVGNLEGMKAGVLASLFHVASSKSNNWHYPHCPTGPDSWCKYNIDKPNGTQSYKPGPGLPLDIIAKIKPIYADLGKDSELEKCLQGKTQNANESFNGLIWD